MWDGEGKMDRCSYRLGDTEECIFEAWEGMADVRQGRTVIPGVNRLDWVPRDLRLNIHAVKARLTGPKRVD